MVANTQVAQKHIPHLKTNHYGIALNQKHPTSTRSDHKNL